MVVTNGNGDGLTIYGLGSTVAVILYDEKKVGGCLQYMLPDSISSLQRAREYPCMFADTGIALLMKSCLAAGAQRETLTARLAGAADLMVKGPGYRVGEENVTAARKILSRLGIVVQAEAIGGCVFRTVRLRQRAGPILSGMEEVGRSCDEDEQPIQEFDRQAARFSRHRSPSHGPHQ